MERANVPAQREGELSYQSRQRLREELQAVTSTLIVEYAGLVPAGSIMRCVARYSAQLRGTATGMDLVRRTEEAVRGRLALTIPAHAAY